MPCSKRDGALVLRSPVRSNSIALHGMGEAVERYRNELTGCSVGQRDASGFAVQRRFDFDLIATYVEAAQGRGTTGSAAAKGRAEPQA